MRGAAMWGSACRTQHVFAEAADSFANAAGNQDEGFYLTLIG